MSSLDSVRKKIIGYHELELILAFWRFKQFKIVFTNGCFDILHRGHVEYLSAASDLGDILIIGLNSDESVKHIKGKGRPVFDQDSRAILLAACSFVDAIVIFDEDTPYNLISAVQPDILVKGGDYNPEDIVGYDIVKAKNGEVIAIDYLEGYSTSALIEKLKHT